MDAKGTRRSIVESSGRSASIRSSTGSHLPARLAKERRDSPRRIDAAVAAVMAHDRAATLAGTARDSIYI